MTIGSKMRSLGESTYFLKVAYEPLKEIMGDKDYIFIKDPLNGYVIHTDRIDDELLENVDNLLNNEFGNNFRKTHYNHNMEILWRDINKYVKCKNIADMRAIEPEKIVIRNYGFGDAVYTTDFTSDGQFAYPVPNIENITAGGFGGNIFSNMTAEIYNIYTPKVVNGYRPLRELKCREIYFDAPELNGLSENGLTKVEKIWCSSKKIKSIDYAFESPYLREVQIDFPILSTGLRGFNKSILEKESALRILNSIPEWSDGKTHELMIGIHIDYQTDDEVLTAITNAESKGWTMTVQWNGTATATAASVTYRLRKPSIYAKVSEMARPDGTTERVLDWGDITLLFQKSMKNSLL